MMKVQTIVVECPRRGRAAYEVSIELTGFSLDLHEVSVIGPDGQEVPHATTEEGVSFERCDGPGVARFQAVVRDQSGNAEPKDAVSLDVVVLPATETAVREAVGSAISGIKAWSKMPPEAAPAGAAAFRLQKSLGEMAAVEVLRRLALDRGDPATLLQSLFLLGNLLRRNSAPWLPLAVLAITSDLAGSISDEYTSDRLLDLFTDLPLPASEKWFYLMRAAWELRCARPRVLSLLAQTTPLEFRDQTAAGVLEICGQGAEPRASACGLFGRFQYAPAAPLVLDWMEAERGMINAGCWFLGRIRYKAGAPRLRCLLEDSGSGSRADEEVNDLARCLLRLQDLEAVPVLLRMMECRDSAALADYLLGFGGEVGPRVREIQLKSDPKKAQAIEYYLKKWGFAPSEA